MSAGLDATLLAIGKLQRMRRGLRQSHREDPRLAPAAKRREVQRVVHDRGTRLDVSRAEAPQDLAGPEAERGDTACLVLSGVARRPARPADVDDAVLHGRGRRDAAAQVHGPRFGAVLDACADDEAVVRSEHDPPLRDGGRHLDQAAAARDPVEEAERRAQLRRSESRARGRAAEHRPARLGDRLPGEAMGLGGRLRAGREPPADSGQERHEGEGHPRAGRKQKHGREQTGQGERPAMPVHARDSRWLLP